MSSILGLLQRKTSLSPASYRPVRDRKPAVPYSPGMRNPERNPYDSGAPTLFAEFPADSKIGRLVRQGDARWRLKEMLEAEEETLRQEQENSLISDRIARERAVHQLDVQYLIRFGVTATDREAFQRILAEVGQTGALSLREAADLVQTTLS
ncbi:MAG: hypothetical protein KDA36_05120 [Planctomycetaceae bacterium]|nr:hypothetical protein [Planctomycetaceae bacterium]